MDPVELYEQLTALRYITFYCSHTELKILFTNQILSGHDLTCSRGVPRVRRVHGVYIKGFKLYIYAQGFLVDTLFCVKWLARLSIFNHATG